MDCLDKNTRVLLALQHVEDITIRKRELLTESVTCPSELLNKQNEAVIEKILGEKHAKSFADNLDGIERIITELKAKNIHWVTYLDNEYPHQLKNINGFPLLLFLKGNVDLINRRILAVVGTRKPTRYGIKVTENFVREFISANLVIVSGFARGIDSTAHKVCVMAEAPTIAVFGCGLDICYPAENRGLYESILKADGLLISEYPLGVKPSQFRFPERNRIISGIGEGVFLPEAAIKSGSLITVNCAIEQGREIFVVPGNIYSEESAGCNDLILQYEGALTLSPQKVLDALHIRTVAKKEEHVQLSIAEAQITDALHEGELHFEDLLEISKLEVGDLMSTLMNLELLGLIEQTSGNYYTLSGV